jgi:signal transduction histidine kinase
VTIAHVPPSSRRGADALERRLVRLTFDLHDGALQDVAALVADVRLFRSQLASVLSGPVAAAAAGGLDDLEARLLSLDGELRELAQSMEPRSLIERPFKEAVVDELEAFDRRANIPFALHVSGSFDRLTRSQRIALLRVLREALTNVREHSDATTVRVEIDGGGEATTLCVTDDGHGFSPASEPAAERDEGRLGLAGMRERIRLLDGTFEVESAPGGPTTIFASVPRWEADTAGR